jgi:hypothetical protein
MRLPRMTTRRWMIAVAALAAILGGYREAIRLRRYRDDFLARAASHVEAEAYHRSLVASSKSSVLRRGPVAQELAAQELTSPGQSGIALDTTVEPWSGLAVEESTRAEEEAHVRFREAQARTHTAAVRAPMIMANLRRRQVEYHQRRAEYHAALGRKYAVAAAYPWLAVAPDPPRPK